MACALSMRLVAASATLSAPAPRPATARPGALRPFVLVRHGAAGGERARHNAALAQRRQWRRQAEPGAASEASSSAAAAVAADEQPETVFYEGSGSNAELAISLLLSATLICLPLTIASIGRRLWVSYKFTNKRLVVATNSPVLKREVQIEYSKIKEIRSAARAFGLWGDVVFFLKDGSRLPLAGLERYQEIVDYVQGKITP